MSKLGVRAGELLAKMAGAENNRVHVQYGSQIGAKGGYYRYGVADLQAARKLVSLGLAAQVWDSGPRQHSGHGASSRTTVVAYELTAAGRAQVEG